jgi:multisubunit Na+/H+ antiporter MnhG subunit
MRAWLIGAVLLGSAVGGILTEIILFRMFCPPDATAAVLGGLWVAMPYLAAAGLTVLLRRHAAALVVLLVALLIAAPVGLYLLNASATQQETAEQQVRDAVHPGEDPHHGPGGMRKSGADMGAAISSAFSILFVVVIPPVQLAAVLIPASIAFGVSLLLREGKARQVPAEV